MKNLALLLMLAVARAEVDPQTAIITSVASVATSLLGLESFPELLSYLEDKGATSEHKRIIVQGNDLGGRGFDAQYRLFVDPTNPTVWNTGLVFAFLIEGAIGFRIPIWSQLTDIYNMITVSPEGLLSLYASGIFEIHLWFIEMKWMLDIDIFEFAPFDFIGKFDPLHPSRNCYGMSYHAKGLDINLNLDWKVNECFLGALAYTWTGFNPYDMCNWKIYTLELPIYHYQIGPWLDFGGEYFRYMCQNWHSAEWENWDYEIDGPTVIQPLLTPRVNSYSETELDDDTIPEVHLSGPVVEVNLSPSDITVNPNSTQ